MELNEHQAVETILGKLEESEKTQPETEAAPQEQASEQPEPEVQETEVEQEREEPAAPAIEPPPTWKAEIRARWKDIPADLHSLLSQQEADRTNGVNLKLNESAEAKKSYETEKTAAAQERQRYAQTLDTLIQQATSLDPVLAQAARMSGQDWDNLWQSNPAQAGQFRHQVEQRQAQIQAWQFQSQQLREQNFRTQQEQAESKLAQLIPEWKDATKGTELKTKIRNTLTSKYGYKPEELTELTDYRSVQVALDAMKYHELMAAKETVKEKKAVAIAPKVVKPSTVTGERGESQRVKALKQRALRTGKESDAVDAVLAALG